MTQSVLAVDDNPDGLYALTKILEHHGYLVRSAASAEAALQLLSVSASDIIVSDVMMPGMNGYELTRRIRAHPTLRYTPIILLTAKDSPTDVAFGLEQGADDYVTKPFEPDELIARLRSALHLRLLYEELRVQEKKNTELISHLSSRYDSKNIIGESLAMREIFALVQKLARGDSAVLITGQSGTGKELIAKSIHFSSARRNGAFIARNCASFSEGLLESELFGHTRGAFTGAIRDARGVFELADGGTLFLDEVGEMLPTMQAKLLRVLQDGVVTPVGGSSERKVNVRILAATNRDLKQMVSDGKFREDLYYRLHVISVHLPPLAERRDDIPLLVDYFLNRFSVERQETKKRFSAEALRLLCSYSFPGNVRELENEIERALVLGDESEVLEPSALSPKIAGGHAGSGLAGDSIGKLRRAVEDVERKLIREALERFEGNKSAAAKDLGISRSNLIQKVQQFGLDERQEDRHERGPERGKQT